MGIYILINTSPSPSFSPSFSLFQSVSIQYTVHDVWYSLFVSTLRLPIFDPREYQVPILKALDSGYKRACMIWHRRAGKDVTLMNLIAKKMWERKGTYFYFTPTYAQGKKIIWNGMTRDGFKFLDYIPPALRKKTDNTEMMVEMTNGSIFQIIGTDNVDSVVGTNPIGCVFSEYSLQDPQGWDYIRPILAENEGWAVFNYTPRGHNHGYDLYKMAKKDKEWFTQILTADDTEVIPRNVLRQERKEIVEKDGSDALYRQEYYCSFEASSQGSYYGNQLKKAEDEKRVGKVPYDPFVPVHTYWDLGVGDATAIWFMQHSGKEIRLFDYYETSGEGLAHYAKVLQERGYIYGEHWAPHDIEVRELGSGRSRKETAQELGITFQVAPKLPLDDGIDAVRNILSSCWFDEEKTARGYEALKNYHKEYDEKNKIFKSRPHHDWSSHGSDALRTMAVSFRERDNKKMIKQHSQKQWALA